VDEQIARNVTGWERGLVGARYLIHDRDAKYTASFDEILKSVAIRPVRLPPHSPNLNAFAERFVKSIKTECLEQFVLFGRTRCGMCCGSIWRTTIRAQSSRAG